MVRHNQRVNGIRNNFRRVLRPVAGRRSRPSRQPIRPRTPSPPTRGSPDRSTTPVRPSSSGQIGPSFSSIRSSRSSDLRGPRRPISSSPPAQVNSPTSQVRPIPIQYEPLNQDHQIFSTSDIDSEVSEESESSSEEEYSESPTEVQNNMSSVAIHPNTKRRSTTMGSTPADLASFFECPVCFDYVLPPIYQCQSGHLVCSQCRPKLQCCPTCRGPLGNIRNLAMEKVANTVFFPCKYQTNGCATVHLHTEKTEHEDVCEFRPYVCPCPGASCKWQGSLEQVMPHLMLNHKSITTLQGEDIVFLATDINLPGAVDWVMMQSCFGHHFMLVLEKQDKNDGQQFFAIVQLIGSRKQAEKFAYRLELNGHRRRLTWEATPRSIHEGVASAILNSDCLVFDTSIAQLFAENGNLGINVTISMV